MASIPAPCHRAGPGRVKPAPWATSSKAQDARINPDSPDFKRVATKALEHVDVILPKLFPDGEVREDGEFRLLNPHRNDRSIGSFGINMTTGKWADFSPAAGGGV